MKLHALTPPASLCTGTTSTSLLSNCGSAEWTLFNRPLQMFSRDLHFSVWATLSAMVLCYHTLLFSLFTAFVSVNSRMSCCNLRLSSKVTNKALLAQWLGFRRAGASRTRRNSELYIWCINIHNELVSISNLMHNFFIP